MSERVTARPAAGPRSTSRLVRVLYANRPFIVVWLALFIAVIGIGMVSPLLPVFAEEMGAGGVWLGLVFSGFALSQIPLMPVVGRLADRFSKKSFLWLGLLIYAVAAAGYFWAPGYQELVLFRVLSGVGAAMVMPIAFSYIGELAPYGHEGRYMGLFNIAMVAGFGLGPVLGGLVHDSLGTDATFISMAILSLAGLFVILLFLPGTSASPGAVGSEGTTELRERSTPLFAMFRDATIRGVTTLQLVFGLLYGTVLAFIGIWMTTALGTGVAQVGIVLSARSIMNGAMAYPFGWLGDRMNRIILITVGMGAVVIGTFSIPWLRSFTPLLGLFVAMGFFESMAMPSLSGMIVEKGRSMGMGSVMGVINMASSLGLVVGSMVGGAIESSVSIEAVFRYVAVLGLVGVVAFVLLMLRSGRPAARSSAAVQSDATDSASEEAENETPMRRVS